MRDFVVLDIETRALPEAIQREIMPKEWPTGNTKDADKLKVAIAEKERAWLDSAPLDAIRSEVMAIGVINPAGKVVIVHDLVEKDMLVALRFMLIEWSDKTIVGHNILGFDLPVLCRRFWKHGIKPPDKWLDLSPWKATWAFDTIQAWSMGNREQRISLDLLAWHLLGQRKSGNGKDFAKLYETDKEAALDYLRNDLKLTQDCYLRLSAQ